MAHQGKHEEAIEECKRAIAVDPTFGNPYNDIGSNLIALGRDEEAIAWLERAKRAPRYEPRHFPVVNLATVYARLPKVPEAIREPHHALAIQPRHRAARRRLPRVGGLL